MKRRRTLHSDSALRQQEIIHAALECFIEKGFTETSIADICRRAKASTGSVYHHFKSKTRLAASVYLAGIRDYQSGMLKALGEQNTARGGIFKAVAYHLKWVEAHPDWARFLFQQRHAEFMGETEDGLHELNVQFAAGMAGWFKVHIEAGRLKVLPRDVFIALLLGPCQEYVRQYIAGHAVSDLDRAIQEIARGVWAALGA